jgi:hypothetical protein
MWDRGNTEPADGYGSGAGLFFVHKGFISPFEMVEFVSNRMSYTVLQSHCDIVLKVHAPAEDKSDDTKDSFYGELEHVFDQFPKYPVKILLDFSAKVGREDVLKLAIGNES